MQDIPHPTSPPPFHPVAEFSLDFIGGGVERPSRATHRLNRHPQPPARITASVKPMCRVGSDIRGLYLRCSPGRECPPGASTHIDPRRNKQMLRSVRKDRTAAGAAFLFSAAMLCPAARESILQPLGSAWKQEPPNGPRSETGWFSLVQPIQGAKNLGSRVERKR